ncbi:MAG: hypothetical protein WCE21_05020 [Candidatus Babeliales bacterium]
MHKPRFLYHIFFILAGTSFAETWQQSPFFNTTIIKEGARTTKLLKKAGFQEGFYTTDDHIALSCLYHQKKDAAYNVVIYSGWSGRRHEGAPFAAMLADQPCNFFLLEGRNNHWSWRFNKRVLEVGEYSHTDIKAAIEFVHRKNKKPIFLLGICAGAFYSAQACVEYMREDKLASYTIRGLIFDSSWASPATAVPSAIAGIVNKRLDMLAGGDGRLNKRRFSPLSRILQACFRPLVSGFYTFLFANRVRVVEQTKNLHNTIHTLPIDIFFIHSADDHIVALSEAQLLASKAQRPTTWWINEPSRHANHHIKYKEQYKERLVAFVHKALTQ